LVIAPLRVAQSTWPQEAAKWAHLCALTVRPVIGCQSACKTFHLSASNFFQ
jgi:hypothetical protein